MIYDHDRMNLLLSPMHFGGITEAGIVAKVVVKGDRDVRAACAALTQDRKFAMEKIQLRFSGPHRGTVVLSSGGAAALSSEDTIEHLLEPLRLALANAMHGVN